jgi:hypothetical protein
VTGNQWRNGAICAGAPAASSIAYRVPVLGIIRILAVSAALSNLHIRPHSSENPGDDFLYRTRCHL